MCPEYLTRILQSIIRQWQRQERDEDGSAGEEIGYEPAPGGRLYAESVGYPPGGGAVTDRKVHHTADPVQVQDEDGDSTGVGTGGVESGNEKQSQWVGSSGPDLVPGGLPGGTHICGRKGA